MEDATLRGMARSCSHTRATAQPRLLSSLATARSLRLFRRIFGSQYSLLPSGIRQWRGHPCQKHPSTNTATRSRQNTKSGRPGTRWRRRHPRILAALRIAAIRSSVLLFPPERMAAMIRDLVSRSTTSAMATSRFSRQAPPPCQQAPGSLGQNVHPA
jgi:hypothetical protein